MKKSVTVSGKIFTSTEANVEKIEKAQWLVTGWTICNLDKRTSGLALLELFFENGP